MSRQAVEQITGPTSQYSSWLGWNFVGQQAFGSVTVDFDFRLNQRLNKQLKGIRFAENTVQWPGGQGWEGLYLQPIGDGSGFSFNFKGKPDTVVVAVWPLRAGPPLLRHLAILDASALARQHNGHLPPTLIFDHRRETAPEVPSGGGQVVTFDDGTSNVTLGINMAGSTTAYGQLPWRKHSWVPTGGANGTGAINMHWYPGMGIGFSPVWITVPRAQHFKLRYVVKQTAPMQHSGSAIKLLRMCASSGCSASSRIGDPEDGGEHPAES